MYKKPKGLLLATPVKRIAPKSAFLKKLEREQEKLLHSEVKAAEAVEGMLAAGVIASTPAIARKLQLVRSYKERRQ